MDLTLKRFCYHRAGTLGVIRIDTYTFWTMERAWKDNTAFVSCIPEGEYEIEWKDSPKFGKAWHVLDVPDRTHILIHAGNFPEDFHGCIGLGTDLFADRIAVANSRVAVRRFGDILEDENHTLKIEFDHHAGL